MEITPGPIIPKIKLQEKIAPIKSKIIIILVVIVIVVLATISVLLTINKRGAQPTIEARDMYLEKATMGVDSSGKELNIEERLAYYKMAAEDFSSIILVNPNDVTSLEKLAAIYLNLGELEKSIDAYSKLIQLNSNNAFYYNYIANNYRELKKDDLARQNYQRSMELNSKIVTNYMGLATIAKEMGDIEEARIILDKGIKENPDSEILKSLLGEYSK